MNFKERVKFYLIEAGKDPDRVRGGYEALATRLSKDLGRTVSPGQVKRYLKSKEAKMKKEGKFKYISKNSKKATQPGAYKYGTGGALYTILKGHFSK